MSLPGGFVFAKSEGAYSSFSTFGPSIADCCSVRYSIVPASKLLSLIVLGKGRLITHIHPSAFDSTLLPL